MMNRPQLMPTPMGMMQPFPMAMPTASIPGGGMLFPPPVPAAMPGIGLLGMMPQGGLLPMQTSVTPMTIVKPEDTIANNVSASDIKVATTIFVGNISDKATDTLIRQILLRCGVINAWKRVQGASGKMQAFGFCEYADPEATLRALRLLHNFKLGDKNLVVKVDSKTRKELLEYIAKKNQGRNGGTGEVLEDSGDGPLYEELDDITKDADERIAVSINQLVKENVDVLTTSRSVEEEGLMRSVEESLFHMAKQSGKIDENADLTDIDMEEDMKHMVSDEIRRFRQSYKDKEEQKILEKKKEREQEAERGVERRERESSKERESAKKDGDKEGRRERESSRSESTSVRHKQSRPRSRERSVEHSTSRSSKDSSKRSSAADQGKDRGTTSKEKEREKLYREEELYEQRRIDKKQRERDAIFKERLKHWEVRERKKLKEYEREKLKEDEKREEMDKDKRHLAEFLEEYDDSKDDARYYKGSAFARRRRERDMELEADERDRQHEREEIEALRLNMMKKQVEGENEEQAEPDKNSSDEESDMEIKEEVIPLSKDGKEPSPTSSYPPIQVQPAPSVSPTFKPVTEVTSSSPAVKTVVVEESASTPDDDSKPKLAFGMKSSGSTTISAGPSKRGALDRVFNQEDEDILVAKKQRKLVPIEYSEEEQQAVGSHLSSDERKVQVQNLIKKIPTEKEDLFAYEVKWGCLDNSLVEKRVKPWINKKIIEYIGEEEPTLVEFIANKISGHSQAQNVLDDVSMVLDEEAEVFVIKLWRLLIYETEAKHKGLSKS